MSTRKLVFWVTMLSVFAMAARISVDTDTWWHLRAGQWMATHHAILKVDLFSYTRYGAPWEYPGWLVEIPMYWLYRAAGPGALNLWVAAMVTLAFGFLWKALSGDVYIKAFVIVLSAMTAAVYWAARPYMVTFLFTAIYFWIFETRSNAQAKHSSTRTRALWLLPLLMLIWVNSHGGFIVGFLIWGVYFSVATLKWVIAAGYHKESASPWKREATQLGGIGILMLIAATLNPSGVAMLWYPFKTLGIETLQKYIQEWQSPDFHELRVQPFLWMIILLLGAVGFSRQRMKISDFLLAAGFLHLSLSTRRNIALFALAASLPITRHLDEMRRGVPLLRSKQAARGKNWLNWAILSVLFIAVVLKAMLVAPSAINETHFRETLPLELVEYLQSAQPAGRLFNEYDWGGYLLWAASEYPVFIDGRTDLYGDEIFEQWRIVVQGQPGWKQIVDQWHVSLIAVQPSRPITGILDESGWQVIYQDEKSVLYQRIK